MRSVRLAFAVLGLVTSSLAADELANLEGTARKTSDRIEITGDQKAAVVHLHSSDGIGSARITRTGGQWPAVMVVRLNVRMLEFFKAGNRTITVEGRLNSKLWDVTPPRKEQLPAVMSQTGDSIDITLPDILFQPESKEVNLEWINAYRR